MVEEKIHDYPLNYGPYPVHLGRTGECGGAGKGTWDAYFSGTQDDVRIYNRALSSGEISQLYTVTHKAQTVDCNPTNTEINPLGTEICDGVDNDCDGQIDE